MKTNACIFKIKKRTSVLRSLPHWIINHDDSRVFVVLYIGTSLILSIAVSLFWLVFAVVIHFVFEWYKQANLITGSFISITARTIWEIFLDIGLVFFALVLAIYIDVIFGVAGIGAAARVGAQGVAKTGARFAAWQRAIKGILLSLDDVVQVSRSVATRKKGRTPGEDDLPDNPWGGWLAKWKVKDYICFAFTGISFILLVLSPLFSPHSGSEIFSIFAEELNPLP